MSTKIMKFVSLDKIRLLYKTLVVIRKACKLQAFLGFVIYFG